MGNETIYQPTAVAAAATDAKPASNKLLRLVVAATIPLTQGGAKWTKISSAT